MIQEFVLGFFLGFYYAKSKVKKSASVSVSVQVDEKPFVPVTSPILIQNSKRKFVPGTLKNFWGSDS
jgi:hypothetical protein